MNLLKDRAFVTAVIILVAVSAVRMLAKDTFAFTKLPVPWPSSVTVSDDYRNMGFPIEARPYAMLARDERGRLSSDNGKPKEARTSADDAFRFEKEDLNTLGIGSNADKELIKSRASNWYLSRVYCDQREKADSNYFYWRLDVTYYTGGLDTVPHIGENCLVAGGASIESAGDSSVVLVPGVAAGWDKLVLRRIVYNTGKDRRMQYYVFSYNGKPSNSRTQVRAWLANPFDKYVYFAKIQFEPLAPIASDEEMDRKTQDFIKSCLPLVLKDLPTVEDVRKLETAKTGK